MQTTHAALPIVVSLFLSWVTVVPAQQTAALVKQFGGPARPSHLGFVEGPDGMLYGWDSSSDGDRRGSVFRLNRDGSNLSIIKAFAGTAEDGDGPNYLIFGADGKLYGTAADSQSGRHGRVFRLDPDGANYQVLRRFDRTLDRTASPYTVAQGSDGKLYSITSASGTLGSSMVFRINPDGTGFEVLHDFEAGVPAPNSFYGPTPNGALVEAPDGKMYGLATGGSAELGMVYRLNRDGSGYEVVHNFVGNGQGGGPIGDLLLASDGLLYGVGNNRGADGQPVIFRIRPADGHYEVVYSAPVFAPFQQRLVESGDGYFYGVSHTTTFNYFGTIYRFKPDGSHFEELKTFSNGIDTSTSLGTGPLRVLHSSDGFCYFATVKQTVFVGVGEYQAALLRFGPVPLPEPPPTPITLSIKLLGTAPTGQVQVTLRASPGSTFELQYADPFPAGWQRVQELTTDGLGQAEYSGPAPLQSALRAFRAVRAASP